MKVIRRVNLAGVAEEEILHVNAVSNLLSHNSSLSSVVNTSDILNTREYSFFQNLLLVIK